jgi:hypothetical protein
MGGGPTTPKGASPARATAGRQPPQPSAPALRFADAAKRLGAATRAASLVVPAFRCPPRVAGARRTVRRYPGGAVVSVVIRDRPWEEVAGDMVEGVVVVNRLEGEAALRIRTALLECLGTATTADPPSAHPEAA